LIAAYLDAVMRKDASVVERFFGPDVEYMVEKICNHGIKRKQAAHTTPEQNGRSI
jgi:hypothetical protein